MKYKKHITVFLFLFTFLFLVVWYMSITTVYNPNGLNINGISIHNIKTIFSNQYNVPLTHIVVWKHQGHAKSPMTTLQSGRLSIGSRPVAGDHIHMAMSIWVNGVARQAEHDRPYEEDIPYEHKENSCRVPGNIAYTKLWPHAGVHTHCDGIVHVHPWSAPHVLRREGTKVTLGMWFDQVGIEYYRQGLAFKNGQRYDNNETHRWRIAEYPCFNKPNYNIYTEQFDRVWLGHAYGSYVLWYGSEEQPPPPIDQHIDTLQRWGAHGFDGKPYPQSCI